MKTFFLLIATVALALGAAYLVPKMMDPKLYAMAYFNYKENTRFDNTIWTYGTDYMIGICMAFGVAWLLIRCKSSTLRSRCIGLIICYAVSVLVGGYCHQTFVTIEAVSSFRYRVLWTVCVNAVIVAGGFIGSIGSHISRSVNGSRVSVPDWFWMGFACILFVFTCMGILSCEQPACDIFLAGITQFVPTVYIMLVLITRSNKDVITMKMVVATSSAFLLNCVLLPMYSIALSRGLALSTVNTILHAWLTMTWCSQFFCLCNICESIDENVVGTKRTL